MTRKEELEVLIAESSKKIEKKRELFRNRIPYMQKSIITATKKLIDDNIPQLSSEDFKFRVNLGRGSLSIQVDGARFTEICTIRIKDCKTLYFDETEEEIMNLKHELIISQSSGGVEQGNEDVEFLKAGLRGIIALELLAHKKGRAVSEMHHSNFCKAVEDVMNEYYAHDSGEFMLKQNIGIDEHKSELHSIKKSEHRTMLKEMGEIRLDEPYREYGVVERNKYTEVVAIEFLKETPKKLRLSVTVMETEFVPGEGYVRVEVKKEILRDEYWAWNLLENIYTEKTKPVEEAA